ncbi:hypothetical protein BJS_01875 [Bradyrhizobium japonicum SEMIA 5079]|nr:hypothetical protein BJS_01875 [Bradyrhizobium japonicum SEMIA 5079]
MTPGSVLLPISGGQIVVNVPKETTVHIPAMMLTRFGGELLKLSNDYSPAPNDYVERLRRFFEGSGLKAYRIP